MTFALECIVLLCSPLLAIAMVTADGRQCPLPQKNLGNCKVVPESFASYHRAGIAAFKYKLHSRNGPSRWGNLNCRYGMYKKYRNCSYCINECDGLLQSPVDINTASADENKLGTEKAPVFYLRTKALIEYRVNTGGFEWRCEKHTICGKAVFNRVVYILRSISIKMGSEHTLDGVSFPLELQWKFTNGKKTLMFSILFSNNGGGYYQLYKLYKAAKNMCQAKVNLWGIAMFVGFSHNLVHYVGSETKPACREGVLWFVSRQVIDTSRPQLKRFRKLLGFKKTRRPLQQLNGRQFTSYNRI